MRPVSGVIWPSMLLNKVVLPEWLRFAQAWYLLIFGTAVVLLMIWLPDGLLSLPDRLRARRQSRLESAARQAAAKQGARA